MSVFEDASDAEFNAGMDTLEAIARVEVFWAVFAVSALVLVGSKAVVVVTVVPAVVVPVVLPVLVASSKTPDPNPLDGVQRVVEDAAAMAAIRNEALDEDRMDEASTNRNRGPTVIITPRPTLSLSLTPTLILTLTLIQPWLWSERLMLS